MIQPPAISSDPRSVTNLTQIGAPLLSRKLTEKDQEEKREDRQNGPCLILGLGNHVTMAFDEEIATRLISSSFLFAGNQVDVIGYKHLLNLLNSIFVVVTKADMTFVSFPTKSLSSLLFRSRPARLLSDLPLGGASLTVSGNYSDNDPWSLYNRHVYEPSGQQSILRTSSRSVMSVEMLNSTIWVTEFPPRIQQQMSRDPASGGMNHESSRPSLNRSCNLPTTIMS
ncbi:hypothetical protein BU15DRAFT_65054 [Melanogaster broomeanus]|nr:hypothetical protein BU15DRAFT_65054 [Melanogaster broomeanus]